MGGGFVENAGPPGVRCELIGPRHVTVIETPVSGADLVDGIDTAIERRERSVPWWGDGYSW